MDISAYHAKRVQALAERSDVDRPGYRRKTKKSKTAVTPRMYGDLKESWEKYKRLAKDPLAVPDQANFETYMAWYACKSEGRLTDERPTLATLLYRVGRFGCMYNRAYNDFVVTDDLLDDIRNYVREVLVAEVEIKDKALEKEYADWEDVKIAIQNLLLHDGHRYRNNRLRAQIICIILLVADNGERIGAIARSEQNRAAERALLYSDSQLFLLPEASPAGEPHFELQIRFTNRKGGHDNDFTQTYHQRDDRAHCIVFWFVTLALLDDAFQVWSTPEELLTRRNNKGRKIEIRFKQSVRSMPIFRRFGPGGGRELSQSLPWGATCATAESQRIFKAAGFPQRFTLYNIRRGVNNEISDGKTNAARRKQIMGHSGENDVIYTKHYQSKKLTIDPGNLFRKEAPRPERREILSMHPPRDPKAHLELSKQLKTVRSQLYSEDKEIQKLLQQRRELQQTADLDHCLMRDIGKALNRRRAKLVKDKLKELRDEHFNGAAVLQSLPSVYDDAASSPEELPPLRRPALAAALYPEEGIAVSLLTSIQVLIDHCMAHDQSDDFDVDVTKGTSPLYSEEEDSRLSSLRVPHGLDWSSTEQQFPGKSKRQLEQRLYSLSEKDPSIPRLQRRSKEDDEQLLSLVKEPALDLTQVEERFPEKSRGQVQKHISKIRQSGVPIPFINTSRSLRPAPPSQATESTSPPKAPTAPKKRGRPSTCDPDLLNKRPKIRSSCDDGTGEWFACSLPQRRSEREMSAEHPGEVIGKLVYNLDTGREEEVYFA